jgi:hypothetical protein
MDDYDVGYGKPPKKTRFKPRTSGNPKGRPVRDPSLLGEIVNSVLENPVQYRENGRTRTASRREVTLKLLVQRAIKGDVGAADIMQRKLAYALRRAAAGSNRLVIRDWLPDHPGQTAEQKTRNLGSAVESATAEAQAVGSDAGGGPPTTEDSPQASATEPGHEAAQ